MLKLLRLEYLFNRRQIIVVLAIFTAYFAYVVSRIESPRVFLVMTSLMMGLSIPFTFLAREDKFKTAALACSLPVRRSTVVASKFAATWAGIGLGLAYALAFAAVFPGARFAVGDVLSLRALLVSLFLISLVFAVILPFTIRFGLTGIIILLVSTQLLGIVALLMTQLIGHGPNPLRTAIRAVEGGLRSLFAREPTPLFLLELAAAISAVNVIALLVGRALYARRDL
jgi:ABC-type transport system involved in multi-copper enzyme maturation permease subunit